MTNDQIIACYNATASAYAIELFDELSNKPLDRILLKQFAAENKDKGKMIDLGCGPGQTTKFLTDNGIKNILGTDLSDGMIAKAKELNPGLQFQAADMLKLDFADQSFGSAVAFYAIVHFNMQQLITAFSEVYRVLQPGGQFLLSFHIGNETVHRDEFFGEKVDIDFYFFRTEMIIWLLKEAGFSVIDAVERFPYVGFEHPTRRAYLRVEKKME